MPSKKYLVIYGIITFIPLIITLVAYPFIPDTVAISFGLDYVAVEFASKSTVWIKALIYFGLNLFMLAPFVIGRKCSIKRYSMEKMQSNLRICMVFAVGLDLMWLLLFYTSAFYNESNPFNFSIWGRVFVMLMLLYGFIEVSRVKKIEKKIDEEIN